jgi:hypothetical protein
MKLRFSIYIGLFSSLCITLCLQVSSSSFPQARVSQLPPLAAGCHFDIAKQSFRGTTIEQARCLLRKVKVRADLEPQPIPAQLESKFDKPVNFDRNILREYLEKHGIDPIEIGGQLDRPLSRAKNNEQNAPLARYLVIHDTSTPNMCEISDCTSVGFPTTINEPSWPYNDPDRSSYTSFKRAHLFILRDGRSVAPSRPDGAKVSFEFPTSLNGVKLEDKYPESKGVFLHVENVQPRNCRPEYISKKTCATWQQNRAGERFKVYNDNVAPDPGFSTPQLRRLALVYIAASVRRSKWLIPTFHAAVDAGIPGAHDDPQNFNLQSWSDMIHDVLCEMKVECSVGNSIPPKVVD